MKYRILEDHLGLEKGQEVVEFFGNTYGLKSEDERNTGLPHMAVSEDGDNPFTIVPLNKLEKIGATKHITLDSCGGK